MRSVLRSPGDQFALGRAPGGTGGKGFPIIEGKGADLAGPGIGTYEKVEKLLPTDYRALLDLRETQHAIHAVKRYIEVGLCRELNLDHLKQTVRKAHLGDSS